MTCFEYCFNVLCLFSQAQKRRFPIDRVISEFKKALYFKPSNLRRRNRTSKEWTVSIGDGLFSTLAYKRDEVIGEFCGTWRTPLDWEQLQAREPWRRGYTIQPSTNSDYLDCYDTYKSGNCILSYANSPIACWDVSLNIKPKANCRLQRYGRKLVLKCGIDKVGSRSPANFMIAPHTELTWNYEKDFINYTIV